MRCEEVRLRTLDAGKAAAAEMERPIVRVRSNMPDLYEPYQELGFMQTMPARQASVALLLQRGVRRYLPGVGSGVGGHHRPGEPLDRGR